jgi:hypothetical protein
VHFDLAMQDSNLLAKTLRDIREHQKRNAEAEGD